LEGSVSILPAATEVAVYFGDSLAYDNNDAYEDLLPLYSGETGTLVTSDVRQVSVRRGRSRWLDQAQSGTMSVTLDNRARAYDPTSGATYSSAITPAKRTIAYTGSTIIFDGNIDDWDLSYTLDGDAVASFVASDVLSRLGRTKLAAHTATSQLSGARVDAVLDRAEVDFPVSQRAIDAGVETLQADTVSEGTGVLQYLQTVTQTESGRLFVSADGLLTFQNRRSTIDTGSAVSLTDDGSGVPFDQIEIIVGSDLLYNRVTVTREGGTAQTGSNTESQDLYEIRALDISGLLFTSDDDALELAGYLANRFGDPALRFGRVQVNLAACSTVQADAVLGLDLGSAVEVKFTPTGGGPQIDRYGVVEKVEHSIAVDGHRVALSLSEMTTNLFVLDDAASGRLDTGGVLAY
jgi:hypothetical protein